MDLLGDPCGIWSVLSCLQVIESQSCPCCACSGVKETLHSHLVSWEFPIDEGEVLARLGLPHTNNTWGALCSKENCSCCARAHPGAPELPEREVRWTKVWPPWAANPVLLVMHMVCLLIEQPLSLLLPVFLQKWQYRPYIYSTRTVLCSLAIHAGGPIIRWCRLYAWKYSTLGILESYPAGVSKSQSPITAAFTIVAVTLPIKLSVAASRFVKALKNKSWGLNVSAIVLQFAILLGECITEER